MKYIIIATLLLTMVWSCSSSIKKAKERTITGPYNQLSDDQLLDTVQYQTFQYFWDGAEPTSGMACERIHMDGIYPENDQNVVTLGGSGFGVMAILVGIERGFITREEGLARFQKIVDYLGKADRFHGAWPHWLDGETGKVHPFGKKDNGGDLVETAFMIQGLLSVAEYFKDGINSEKKMAADINKLWEDVEWDWYTKGGEDVLYWHWSPSYGWEMNFPVKGYNECLIMYILAASSPTHPIKPNVYHNGWARGGGINGETTKYGYTLKLKHNGAEEYGGPLFWAHYSYLGLDPRNLKDQYANYWDENLNQVMIDFQYCVENPKGYKGYGADCWGLTASYSVKGYNAHMPSNDLGVISPTAALSSFPYSPKESMQFLKYLYFNADTLVGKYGPYDAFSVSDKWFLPRYLAIDQGPIPVMIENYRTGFLWKLFMGRPEIREGLLKLGFTAGKE